MRLDKYKLVEETPEHFRVDDGSGPFRVAKKGLGKGTLDRISQHFAAGGMVQEDPSTNLDDPYAGLLPNSPETLAAKQRALEDKRSIVDPAQPDVDKIGSKDLLEAQRNPGGTPTTAAADKEKKEKLGMANPEKPNEGPTAEQSMVRTGLGLAGGVIGGIYGGPIGAAVGSAAGTYLGGALTANKGGEVQRFAMGGGVQNVVGPEASGTIFRPNMGVPVAAQASPDSQMMTTPPPAPPPMIPEQPAPPPMSFFARMAETQRMSNQLDQERIARDNANATAGLNRAGRAIGDTISNIGSKLSVPEGAESLRRRQEMAKRGLGPAVEPPAAAPVVAPTVVAPPAPAEPPAQPTPPPPVVVGGPGAGVSGMAGYPGARGDFGASKAQADYEAGIRAQGEAAKAQANAEAVVRQRQDEERQVLQLEFKRRFDDHQRRGDELFSNIMNSKVDPNRLWNQRTTGQKMGSLAAIIMSGIGQGLAGGPNMAMQVLDNAIERDIASQKTDLEKKQGLLSFHSQQGRDAQASYQLTKADMLDGFAAQLQKTAAQYYGQKSDADVQKTIAEVRMKAVDGRKQAAQLDTKNWIDMQRLNIDMANANQKAGLDKADKETLTEVESRYRTINGNLDRLRAMIKRDGTWDATGSHNAKIQQYITNIANDAAKVSDPKSVNRESEVKAYKELLGDPGFWSRNATVEETLENFRSIVEQQRNTAYQVRGMGAMVPPASLRPGRE